MYHLKEDAGWVISKRTEWHYWGETFEACGHMSQPTKTHCTSSRCRQGCLTKLGLETESTSFLWRRVSWWDFGLALGFYLLSLVGLAIGTNDICLGVGEHHGLGSDAPAVQDMLGVRRRALLTVQVCDVSELLEHTSLWWVLRVRAGGTPWTGHAHILTHCHFLITNGPNKYIFGLWEKARAPTQTRGARTVSVCRQLILLLGGQNSHMTFMTKDRV